MRSLFHALAATAGFVVLASTQACSGTIATSSSGGIPAGHFPCGSTYCATASEYCYTALVPAMSCNQTESCAPLPASCGAAPTCACVGGSIAPHVASIQCSGDAQIGFTVFDPDHC